MFDHCMVRYLRIRSAEILNRQTMDVIVSRQPSEVLQLFGADAEVIFELLS